MENIIYLKKGAVYFYAAFMDESCKIPNIQTWVYLGSHPEDGHTFKSTCGEEKQFCFPNGITSNVLDHTALSKWLLEAHSPKRAGMEYVYKAI
ncbi:MAG: hypothetical protein AB2826_19905 [Candidatus Thiodiazotropha sp.]